ncbi:MAG: pilus assembly protein PilM, partial [Candidatus Omnitrophica bacterium]|nr:pilus assembly protein PilM [Candidatus Omnitrophota bacterium]
MIELGGLLRSGAVGLVIRPTEVEVIERRGKRISAYARVPIQGTEDDHLVAAIKAAVASAGVRRKAMAVSIAGHDVLVRSFTIPVVPKAEWEGAVRFEARKYIPFKPEQLAWSAQAARGADKDKESVVVFVGIQQERLHRLQALLAQAGVQPLLIEPQAISLGRVIQLGRAAAASEAVCVVDAGPGGGELAVLRDGLPFITRSFRFSAESPQARAEQLQGEISLSTAFFQREHPGSPLRGILLFGPDQDVEGWRGQLQGRFAAPVESGAAVVRRAVGEGLPLGGASAAGLALGAARRDGG